MSDPVHYKCVVSLFEDGAFHFQMAGGAYMIVALGPAQVMSSKRGLDKYIDETKPDEEPCKVEA